MFYAMVLSLLGMVLTIVNGDIPFVETSDFLKSILKSLFIPLTGDLWWFATTYVFLMLISPLLNNLFRKLQKKNIFLLLILTWFLWYVVSDILDAGYVHLKLAIFFYMVGAYINIGQIEKNRMFMVVLFLIGWFGSALSNFMMTSITSLDHITFRLRLINWIGNTVNVSLFVPLAAISLFLFIKDLKIKTNPLINLVGASTFGVYLIHDSLVGRYTIWHSIFHVATVQYHSIFFPIYAIITIIIVFAFCSFVDILRMKYIEPKMMQSFDKIKFKIMA